MPPKEKLASKDVAALERWIRDGAAWPEIRTRPVAATPVAGEQIGDAWTDPRNPIVKIFGGERLDLWSLKPVKRPELPSVKGAGWVKHDLDRFVLARLEKDGISPPLAVENRSLARRLHFDLTGLPPTPEQVDAFEVAVRERGPDAALAERVDQLLASPRFGEHWASLWLDVVRYSDSNGFDWDEFRPQAWQFRDYVIRSLNADKPYDRFLREQLAGDELLEGPPKTAAEQDMLIATGYLRLGPHDNAAGLFDEKDRSRAELMADLTETTAGGFLGLTMNCCRCHDHKYDPLSQADHYRLRAFFAAVKFADSLPINLADEQQAIRAHNDGVEARLKPLRKSRDALPEKDEGRKNLDKAIRELELERRSFQHALVATDAEKAEETLILFQGNHKQPREAVLPGILSALDPQPAKIVASLNPKTTGRRATLANWITLPANPLTARVFVNRVWLSLQGRPLVGTPNDFGLAGSRPEDAALLDYLADEFVRQKWSVKQLVRMIVSSAAYRQMPTFQTETKNSEHFALRSPRRLRAEQLRDALLSVSGLLTSKTEGPPIWPTLPKEVLESNPAFLDDNAEKTKGWYPSPANEQYARSIFLVKKRNTRVPLLEIFDQPENSVSCARRGVSTVAPQALTLLHSPLAVEAAQALAQRVIREAGTEPARQIERAFLLTLERRPTVAEAASCQRLLAGRSLQELCRALLNLNEFAYVD